MSCCKIMQDGIFSIISKESINQKSIDANQIIYHYCSPDALCNILKKQSLWFTDVKFFLDKSEIKYAFEVLESAIAKVEINPVLSERLQKYARDQSMNELMKDFNTVTNDKKNFYVASFSMVPDDLFMWNSYTKSDDRTGYSIGFDSTKLIEELNAASNFRILGQVLYNKSEQETKMIELIRKCDSRIVKYPDENNLVKVLCSFPHAFLMQAVFCKSPVYFQENEYRIVIEGCVSSEMFINPIDGTEYDYPIKVDFRQHNGIIIPYFEIRFDKSCIKSITPSPFMDYDEAILGLERIKQSYAYKYSINKSQI